MRIHHQFLKHKHLLVFFAILIQFHCLLNPVVREILELDPSKKDDNLRNLGLLLSLFSGPTASITPSIGNVILANTQIRIVFNRSMDQTSVLATLGTNLTQTWSDTNSSNDTVTLTGSIPIGNQSFRLDGSDQWGFRMTTVTGNYTILSSNTNLYYVSTSGNNGNPGTSMGSPKLTIPSAITAATAPAAILVSEGNYVIDSGLGTQINLVNNVSLYGGLSSDFLNRNSTVYVTRIVDTATASADSIAINAGPAVTSATVVDGFSVQGATNPNAPIASIAFNCLSGAPTITNNHIEAGSTTNGDSVGIHLDSSSAIITNNNILGSTSSASSSFGIYIRNNSSPSIVSNTIHGGNAPLASAHGIYNAPESNTPSIIGNTFYGGTGAISYALNTSPPSNPTVWNNIMDGGAGISSRALYFPVGSGNYGNYQNNILFTSGGSNRFCVYEEGGTNPLIFNGNHLHSCPTALYFDEGETIFNNIDSVNGGTTNGSGYSGNY